MNFKGNSFSLGAGDIISTDFINGLMRVFIKRNSVIGLTEFDKDNKTMRVLDANASYCSACWQIADRLLELNDGELTFENR